MHFLKKIKPCKVPYVTFRLISVRKRTRWGSETEKVLVPPGAAANPNLIGKSPELVAYAMRVFGTVDLEEQQWKQCNDQMKAS